MSALFAASVEVVERPARLAHNGWLLLTAAALLGLTLVIAQWRVAGRVWLERLTAGPATVTLATPSNSYFDDYLDEIVYYFTASRCRVVIFEDLDRFNNAHIFETLRGLNTILNNAKQLRATTDPIRFVYAVRDSIFDLLDADAGSDLDAAADAAPRTVVDQPTEAPSTSRTKFFDLVVPLVPFITTRTSRDLISREMSKSPDTPGPQVIKVVARHVADMRLVHNIRNEFEVFRTRILPSYGGLPWLSADRLFAMIAYKNLHLSDFEKIKSGTSKLDQVYDAYRQLVNEQIAARQQHIHDLQDQLDRALLTPERCAELGERLIDFITSATEFLGYTRPNLNQPAVQAGGNQYALSAATSQEFWHEALSTTGPINLVVAGLGWRPVERATLGRVVGTGLEPDDWQPEARAARSERIREAEKEIDELRWADLTTIFGRTDLTVTTQHGQISLSQMATRTLESPLAVDLLTSGYIDQNFALYVAQYYDVHVGPSAMNFILHVVQRGAQDFEYTFDDARDVPDLIEELGTGFVGTQSAYNIAIFDYLLTEGADLVRLAVASLTRGTENDLRFIDAYLNRGADPELFIGQLSFVWDDTFTYLAATDRFTEPLLSAALNNCAADRSYATNDRVRAAIETMAHDIAALKPGGAGEPRAIAEVLVRLGVRIHDLSALGPDLRRHVIEHNAYRVTQSNLVQAVGDPDASLSLDALASDHPRIRDHVVDHLADYVKVLHEDPHLRPIQDSATFAAVLSGLAKAAPEEVAAVIERCDDACRVADLNEIPVLQWPTVVSAGRCSVTMSNINAYLEAYSEIDDALGSLLAVTTAIDEVGDVPPDQRQALGAQILNAESIPLSRLKPLLEALRLDAPISAQAVTRAIGPVIPDLVSGHVLADDQAAFRLIAAEDWATKERLIITSESFAEYLPQLGWSGSDVVRLFTSPKVPHSAQLAALWDAAVLQGLAPREATLVADRAATELLTVPLDSVVALASAGAEPGQVLRLLPRQIDQLPSEDVFRLFGVMPEPYASVAGSTVANPALIPAAHRDLFEQLRTAGQLHSVEKIRSKPTLRVARVV